MPNMSGWTRKGFIFEVNCNHERHVVIYVWHIQVRARFRTSLLLIDIKLVMLSKFRYKWFYWKCCHLCSWCLAVTHEHNSGCEWGSWLGCWGEEEIRCVLICATVKKTVVNETVADIRAGKCHLLPVIELQWKLIWWKYKKIVNKSRNLI